MNPFKAYDIRGVYPHQVNEDLAYDIGRALPLLLKAKTLVIGRDMRASSDSLFDALLKGCLESGTNVVNLGLCTTPQFYYALYSSDVDGGIMITASHNSKEYNGFKICEAHAKPVFKENKLPQLEKHIAHGQYKVGASKGHHIQKDITQEYMNFFAKLKVKLFTQNKSKKKFHILVDTGNGMGAYEVQVLKKLFPEHTFDVLFEELDGNFPNHECNPIIEAAYTLLHKKLQGSTYDFGMAFDGDADRVTFFTRDGMIPPDIMTGVIGCAVAKKGEKVGFEVRTSQAVPAYLKKHKVIPCLYPSGHAYIKSHMIKDRAVFAGEKSGHYFYQSLHNTDSSLYTVIHLLALLDSKNTTLKMLTQPLQEQFVNSGEVNYTAGEPDVVLKHVQEAYSSYDVKHIDGVSVYGEGFFFNIRKSNTEPLVRVNIEATTKEEVQNIKEKIESIIARN